MVNAYLNRVKAKLTLEVKKPDPELIFFVELDRFANLSSILPPPNPLPPSVPSSFSSALGQTGLAETDGAIVINIEVSGAAILPKP